MSDHEDHGGHSDEAHDHGDGHDHGGHGHGDDDGRVTSPMQDFGMSQVTTGLLVLVVGLAVAFGVPLLL
ncbi:DUF7550 family protein [Halobellus clavatus]|jgi:hypothetical protein|uniref:Uncharacterized protein n=1 Tax=Halobellus clavatus TaxID=660517 RepID=A0A1H3CV44_9EURY|nr:hypothetical protein [Halobellus clavatus]SDX58021.1 hypothetical protein SAMN04487946_101216 [Halobellus clavatus]